MPKILIFHSYSSSPCLDGLVSCLLLVVYGSPVKLLVPHRRSPGMNHILKDMMKYASVNDSAWYLDIGPVSHEELKILNEKIANESIFIIDHHILDMRPEELRLRNIKVELDINLCVAVQMFEKYKEVAKKYESLMNFIQFTEYEGTNDNLQRLKLVQDHCEKHFRDLIAKFSMTSLIYAIVDELLSTTNKWNTLIPFKILKNPKEAELFKLDALSYLDSLQNIVEGKDRMNNIEKRLKNRETLAKIPKASSVVQLPMKSGKLGRVMCTEVDIRAAGRSIEPIVRSWMKQLNCQYAILLNPVKDQIIYISLRRANGSYNAIDLATALGVISGSNRYGGHPWGAGITLTMPQYEKLMKILNSLRSEIEN